MEDEQKIYWSALAKYFSGNASEDEEIFVYQKRKQDKAFEEAYQQAKRLWKQPSIPAGDYEPDVEKGWQRLQMKASMRQEPELEAIDSKVPVSPKRFPWAVAASIIFLLTAGWWLSWQPREPAWIQVQTSGNEIKKVELPDGSQVSLNENSELSYPETFLQESREVKLTGEAYFQVQKAEGKRFTVYAAGTKTEVIGTAFYLQAYPEKEVKIQVTEGRVAFANVQTEEAVFLTPGMEAVMGKSLLIPRKEEIKDVNFQSWESKKLVFADTELAQLVETLEDYFDTSILIRNAELKNCRFTASFEDPELEEVLDIISITGNLTISKEGNRLIISGKACH